MQCVTPRLFRAISAPRQRNIINSHAVRAARSDLHVDASSFHNRWFRESAISVPSTFQKAFSVVGDIEICYVVPDRTLLVRGKCTLPDALSRPDSLPNMSELAGMTAKSQRDALEIVRKWVEQNFERVGGARSKERTIAEEPRHF